METTRDGRGLKIFLVVLFFALLAIVALYSWPAALFGADESALSNSFEQVRPPPGSNQACVEGASGWVCESGSNSYAVEIDWKGCWTATGMRGEGSAARPDSVSSCITLPDLVFG